MNMSKQKKELVSRAERSRTPAPCTPTVQCVIDALSKVKKKNKDSVVFLDKESNGGWSLGIKKNEAVTMLADNFGLVTRPVAFPLNGTEEEQSAALGLPPGEGHRLRLLASRILE
jgi:hypothetical protein